MRHLTFFIFLFLIKSDLIAQCSIEQYIYNTGGIGNGFGWYIGQSFVACESGTLDFVQVRIHGIASGSSTFKIEFFEGESNDWSNVLWSSQNQTNCAGCQTVFNIDMSLGSGTSRNVVSGMPFRIRVIGVSGANHAVQINNTNPYSGGILYNGNFGEESNRDMYFGIEINFVLPVELSGFTAVKSTFSGHEVDLTWHTASESNSSHFTIQHSTNGTDFREIGSLPAHGTTTEPHSYEFVHESPAPGDNYYRLKIVDYDGGFEYSSISQVWMEDNGSLRIFPNPVQGDFMVHLAQPDGLPFTASLFDINGSLIFSQTYDAETLDFTVTANGLPSGIYHLKIVDEMGRVQWGKVVKAN